MIANRATMVVLVSPSRRISMGTKLEKMNVKASENEE
jgi:hypothetical protein